MIASEATMNVEKILADLVRFPSVSSTSNLQITSFVQQLLVQLGFACERVDYRDRNGVEKANLIARRGEGPELDQGLAYFSHTDVVPVENWQGCGEDPFRLTASGGRLYGRGSCDMKGSLACMLAAASQIRVDDQTAPLYIVCTADEETGFCGARQVTEQSEVYRHMVATQPVAIIGEPTRLRVVHAHKGIFGIRATSRGRAAHSSTTEGVNANRKIIPFLNELLAVEELTARDERYKNSSFDPPTVTLNYGVSDRCDAINITPDCSTAWASLRPMPHVDCRDLIERLARKAAELDLEFEELPGSEPLWIEPDRPFVQAMLQLTGEAAPQTVCYCTDGGIFRDFTDAVVCGPGDIAQAHTVDEYIDTAQLAEGVVLFRRAIERWCCRGARDS